MYPKICFRKGTKCSPRGRKNRKYSGGPQTTLPLHTTPYLTFCHQQLYLPSLHTQCSMSLSVDHPPPPPPKDEF